MSILDYDDTHIKLIYRIRGEGTKILSEKKPGEKLDVLIGLGNGFTDTDYNEVIVVGGGSGTPPMYGLAKRLIAKGVKVSAVLGFNGSYDVSMKKNSRSFVLLIFLQWMALVVLRVQSLMPLKKII